MPADNTRPVAFHLVTRSSQDRNSPSPPTNSGFRADFQHVIRGLSPFMDRSQNINVGNWLRHSTALLGAAPGHRLTIHQHGIHPFGALPETGISRNNDRSDFVVSVENETGSPPSTHDSSLAGGADGGTYASGNNNNDPMSPDAPVGQHADGLRQRSDALSVIEKYMPFFLILLAKLIYDHFIGEN